MTYYDDRQRSREPIQRTGRRVAQQANPFQDEPQQQAPTDAYQQQDPGSPYARGTTAQRQPPVYGAMPNGRPAPYQDPGPLGLQRPVPPGTPSPQQPQPGPGAYRNQMEGVDWGKFDNPEHTSPKYQIARVLQNFDPRQGITPDVLAALNALGIGTFGGSRDQLTVGGNVDPRFEGVTAADVVRNFSNDGTGSVAWQGWGGVQPGGPGVQPGGGGMPPALSQALMGRAAPSTPFNRSVDPFAASGGGVFVNGGWVPRDHPAAAGAPGPGAAAASQSASVYTPGTLPTTDLPQYQPFQFSQFQAPEQQPIVDAQRALLQRVLQSPESLSEPVVSQMKERHKEEALAMQKQLGDQAMQRLAGRGFSGAGGLATSTDRRLGEATQENILGGYRDIDIAKSQSDRADQLAALGAAEGVLSGEVGRAGDIFQNTLAGQGAQSGDARFGYGAGADATRFALERALSQEGLSQAGAASSLQERLGLGQLGLGGRELDIRQQLGLGGLNLDYSRLGESGRQFDLAQQLAEQEFRQRGRQFDDRLGFDYGVLNYNAQMDPWKYIFGGGRG